MTHVITDLTATPLTGASKIAGMAMPYRYQSRKNIYFETKKKRPDTGPQKFSNNSETETTLCAGTRFLGNICNKTRNQNSILRAPNVTSFN